MVLFLALRPQRWREVRVRCSALRVVVAALAGFSTVLALCGCGSAAHSGTAEVKVMVLYPFLGDQSYVRERLGSIYETKKYPKLRFTINTGPSRTNVTFFVDQVKLAEKQGYKVLAINTGATAQSLVPLIDKAVSDGLKVVSFDGTAPAALHITSDVNYSNYAASEEAGHEWEQLLPHGGQIGIIQCFAGLPDTDAFIDGFKAVIASAHPAFDVVQQADAHCEPTQSKAIVEHMLRAHPDLVGIYDSVDVSAQGSLEALMAAHSKAILGSIGGQEYALRDIASGRSNWKFTVPYPFELVGEEAIAVAAAVAERKAVQPVYLIPVQPVATAANAAEVLSKIQRGIAEGQ